MRFAFVLENETRFQKEISEALHKADKKVQIRLFTSLEQFFHWIQNLIHDSADVFKDAGQITPYAPQEPYAAGEHTLGLLVSKVEFLGADQISLLKKTQDLFVRKKLCTKEDPAAIVLTVFGDSPTYAIKDLEDRVLTNVICKPFDKLILEQHLIFALSGRHPASSFSIVNQKTSAVIEMLKDVQLEQLSEVGFVTRSNRQIALGRIAKYYAEEFNSDRRRSLMAVVVACRQHPANIKEYECVFRFIGIEQTQISRLRRQIRSAGKNHLTTFDWPRQIQRKIGKRMAEFVLIESDTDSKDQVKSIFTRRFGNFKITDMETWENFLHAIDPKLAPPASAAADQAPAAKNNKPVAGKAPASNAATVKAIKPVLPKMLDAIFVQHQFVDESRRDLWTQILKRLNDLGLKPDIYVLSGRDFSDIELRSLAEYVTDIFYKPYDRVYMAQKVKVLNPDIEVSGDPIDFPTLKHEKMIRTANSVAISEISEAGLKLNYYRPISPGSFREFVLWQPYEYGAPELKATCNFSEPGSNKDHVNHFVFFGITDHYLKAIRLWIRENYVHQKEKGG